MPQAHVPVELTDLALNALEDEVGCWRRIPMYPGVTRLMRVPPMGDIGPAEIPPDDTQAVIYHDVPAKNADDLLLRMAMEKVVEAVLGAVSVSG
jgi:hypothetical protein